MNFLKSQLVLRKNLSLPHCYAFTFEDNMNLNPIGDLSRIFSQLIITNLASTICLWSISHFAPIGIVFSWRHIISFSDNRYSSIFFVI